MSDLNVGGFSDQDLYGSEALANRGYGSALVTAARRDPRLLCLGADLSLPTETHLFRDTLPDRFFMIGMQEANLIGVAGGMARMGFVPFAHSFCVFLTRRVYDQVACQIAYPRTNVKLVGFIPGLTTPLGVSHQAIDDVALMRSLPNMVVIEPSRPSQIEAAVDAALGHEGPVYLRMLLNLVPPPPDAAKIPLTFGKGRIVQEGRDVAIIAAGIMVEQAEIAGQILAAQGLSATIVDMHTIKPLDADLVRRLAKSHRVLVTAENHSTVGGLGSAVAEVLALSGLAPRFGMIGLQDTFASGGWTEYLLKTYQMTGADIAGLASRLHA